MDELTFFLFLCTQVEEYGRDMYKLVKTFLSKWKQQKGKELGGGMKRDPAAVVGGKRAEEGDEFAPLKMARTAHEQVKTFKVLPPIHISLNKMVPILKFGDSSHICQISCNPAFQKL